MYRRVFVAAIWCNFAERPFNDGEPFDFNLKDKVPLYHGGPFRPPEPIASAVSEVGWPSGVAAHLTPPAHHPLMFGYTELCVNEVGGSQGHYSTPPTPPLSSLWFIPTSMQRWKRQVDVVVRTATKVTWHSSVEDQQQLHDDVTATGILLYYPARRYRHRHHNCQVKWAWKTLIVLFGSINRF